MLAENRATLLQHTFPDPARDLDREWATMMELTIREMTAQDYEAVFALWQNTEGVGLSSSDSAEQIAIFLGRNPGLSCVAWDKGVLVGAVLCGHDGRRGYIHHLAVRQSHRHAGIGRKLVKRCLERLRAMGILKCHLFVFADNQAAISFWERIGWIERFELKLMSHMTTAE